MSKKTTHGEARGRDIHDGKQRALTKRQPAQLSLFQTFLPAQDDRYSNTIEFYDAVPKYFTNKRQMAAMREGPEGREIYLPTLEREFRHLDAAYTLKIKPARAEDRDGNELEYYPSEQEELLEEALRKLACDRLNGVYLGPVAGVQFTMYELREELRRRGHAMAHDELRRSLLICRSAGLRIERKGEKEVLLDSSIFPTVMISNRKEWKADPKNARCYVQFNPLVTASIEAMTYRQFDYETLMSYGYQLSRWLHKRLFHNYVNASMMNHYSILLSTVKRDSGLLNNNRTSKDIQYLERSLEELVLKNVIFGFEKDIRRGKQNSIEDVLYTLMPSMHLISEMKKSNKRVADNKTTSPVRLPGHKNM
jgi:hypothetical protein